MTRHIDTLLAALPAMQAILAIAVLDGIALAHGINHELAFLAFTAIGGLGGWTAHKVVSARKS
jgi:hypothetical protein